MGITGRDIIIVKLIFVSVINFGEGWNITVATPALGLLGLSLSYEMRGDFVKFKFRETSLKLFNLIHIKSKEEAGHRINHQCLWRQLLFKLNVLSRSGSTKLARLAVQRNNERENDFQTFFRIKSSLLIMHL